MEKKARKISHPLPLPQTSSQEYILYYSLSHSPFPAEGVGTETKGSTAPHSQ